MEVRIFFFSKRFVSSKKMEENVVDKIHLTLFESK